MRQNRVRIWIDRHITSRVTEFFLTDWRQAFRPPLTVDDAPGAFNLGLLMTLGQQTRIETGQLSGLSNSLLVMHAEKGVADVSVKHGSWR